MNNTHFAIVNDENTPFAIFRKGHPNSMEAKMKMAIKDETGEEVLDIQHISFNDEWGIGETIIVKLTDNTVRYNIVPTWEY